jgi:hypothetical protein
MNSYNNIVDPGTGNTFSIFSTQGKTLLKHYVKLLQSGGMMGMPAAISDRPEYPLLQPLLSRQPSLGEQMAEENERANAALRNASNTVNNQPKSKTVKRDTRCVRLENEINSAKNEIVNLQTDYNRIGCSEKYNQQVTDAFSDLDPLNRSGIEP